MEASPKTIIEHPNRQIIAEARGEVTCIAQTLGESVGRTVGYRMRFDTRVSRDTRIEVVTEGVLTRLLQSDPALEGVAAVIFDEFHERSLQADLGVALALDAREHLTPGLRLARALRLRFFPVDDNELRSGAYWWFYRADKARAELGFTTRPLDETLADTIAWFRADGYRRH